MMKRELGWIGEPMHFKDGRPQSQPWAPWHRLRIAQGVTSYSTQSVSARRTRHRFPGDEFHGIPSERWAIRDGNRSSPEIQCTMVLDRIPTSLSRTERSRPSRRVDAGATGSSSRTNRIDSPVWSALLYCCYSPGSFEMAPGDTTVGSTPSTRDSVAAA